MGALIHLHLLKDKFTTGYSFTHVQECIGSMNNYQIKDKIRDICQFFSIWSLTVLITAVSYILFNPKVVFFLKLSFGRPNNN